MINDLEHEELNVSSLGLRRVLQGMLSEEQIEKFQKLYKKKFGKEISHEEAYDKGIKLVRLVDLIYKPMTEQEYLQFKDCCHGNENK